MNLQCRVSTVCLFLNKCVWLRQVLAASCRIFHCCTQPLPLMELGLSGCGVQAWLSQGTWDPSSPDQGLKSRPLHCKADCDPWTAGEDPLGCLFTCVHVGVCVAGCVCCKPQQPGVVAQRLVCGRCGRLCFTTLQGRRHPTFDELPRLAVRALPGIHALTPESEDTLGWCLLPSGRWVSRSSSPRPSRRDSALFADLCSHILHSCGAENSLGGLVVWVGPSLTGTPASYSCFASPAVGLGQAWPVSTSIT